MHFVVISCNPTNYNSPTALLTYIYWFKYLIYYLDPGWRFRTILEDIWSEKQLTVYQDAMRFSHVRVRL